MTLNFEVDYMKILEADDDVSIVELDLLHTGKNRNQYIIDKEAVEKALPTFYNKPIIYRLDNEFIPSLANDVVEHGTEQDRTMRIAGVIPESAPMTFVKRDGKEYLRTKGIIYKIYQPSLMNILANRDGNVKVSIEIAVMDKFEDEDGAWNVTDFVFEGVALLGANILEGIEGSRLNVFRCSANDLNAHYKTFMAKEIPQSVKDVVSKALAKRKARGTGGSSASVSMANYLIGYDYIDNLRFKMIKDYFSTKHTEGLSYELYGGDEAKKWVNGEKINNAMNNISDSYLREQIYTKLEDYDSERSYRYYLDTLYIEPTKVVVHDNAEAKIYVVPFEILEDNEINLRWDMKQEVKRCYLPVDKMDNEALLFNYEPLMGLDKEGQLITNTHKLSTVNSAVTKIAEILNSLEKGEEKVNEEEKVENACDEEAKNCDNCKNCDTSKNCDTKMNAEDEAKKVEDEEKDEDRKEDDKEEDDEDEMFKSKLNALVEENEKLKASLAKYEKEEEINKMNALINEFAYCFAENEKAELVKNLATKTFAEVNDIVNVKVREFAKNNMPNKEDEHKEAKFSVGLLAHNFEYKAEKGADAKNIKEIKEKYSK